MNEIYLVWDVDDDNVLDEAGVHFDYDTAEVFMIGFRNCNGGNYKIKKFVEKQEGTER